MFWSMETRRISPPHISEANDAKLKNIVHASPAVPLSGRRLRERSHFDFALIRTSEPNQKTDGTPLQGMCCCPHASISRMLINR